MKRGCESPEAKAARSVELPILSNSESRPNTIRRSRTSRWRAASLITLTLLMVAHFVQWQFAGKTVSPIEPSEAMYTLQNGAINAGFIFFALAIVATLVLGRFVCGWGCHIVALQDLCAWLMKKLGITPRPFRSRLLVFVPLIVALYMFVWPTVIRYISKPAHEPLIPQFTNHLVTNDFWATFPSLAVAIPFLIVCGFMTVYFLGSKGFCTYACPYGGFFGIADKFASGRIRVTDACSECGHCTATCTSNVIVHAEVKKYGMVVDPGCMKCMDCVSVCPNDALYFGFGKPSIAAHGQLPRNYSLTWPEELIAAAVFAASFLAVWDVYQLVPMLMALGIATVTTYVVVRLLKLFRSTDLAFLRYVLRSSGKLTRAGWTFVAFASLWIALNAHSGWVRYHERAGNIAFESIRVPDELALARTDPGRWISTTDRKSISSGRYHFRAAMDRGFFVNGFALSKLAWLEYLDGDAVEAVRTLTRAAAHQDGDARAMSLYYRGAILNRMQRSSEALQSLDEALTERPELFSAREEQGEALWRLGRRDEALKAWREVTDGNPNAIIANYLLAGAAQAEGRESAFAEYLTKAETATPNDALFNWMIGMRLQNLGMSELAEKRFQRAIEINPEFRRARELDVIDRIR